MADDRFQNALKAARTGDGDAKWLELWALLRSETSAEKRRFTRELEITAANKVAQRDVFPDGGEGRAMDMTCLPQGFAGFNRVPFSQREPITARIKGIQELHDMSKEIRLSQLLESCQGSPEKPLKTSVKARTVQRGRRDEVTEWTGKKRKVIDSQGPELPKESESLLEGIPRKERVKAPATRNAQPGDSFRSARDKLLEDQHKKLGKLFGNDYKATFLRKGSWLGAKNKTKCIRPGAREGNNPCTGDMPADGQLSSRTMTLLCGETGELPESLKGFDPVLIETVCSEILDDGKTVRWDDIAGQETVKQLIQEIVVWPMMNPRLFQGPRAPPRGLLLFGPPGTGKTLIGKAIASNIQATFFSISAASLSSKWVGDGEKMVRILFAAAAALQPTVIFIDEIDSVLSARKTDGEHESSRKIKTELLVQMDGCTSKSEAVRIFIVGATNRPQELDEAARRRLPKQLYVPLPGEAARAKIIHNLLSSLKSNVSDNDVRKIVQKTAGYSGADMSNLIQEASQGPVRELLESTGGHISDLPEEAIRPIRIRDFQMAARVQKPSVDPTEIDHYVAYNEKHGAKMMEIQSGSEEEDW